MTLAILDKEPVATAVALHRELCRGLAIGIQAGQLAIRQLGRDHLVVVAEGEHCALDGIQAVTGATLGNRSMVVHDWGKLAYTFYRVSDGRGLRMSWKAGLDPRYERLRRKVYVGEAAADELARFEALDTAEIHRILEADPATLFRTVAVTSAAWVPPTVGPWVNCERCGEPVMENRTLEDAGEIVCIPCAKGLAG